MSRVKLLQSQAEVPKTSDHHAQDVRRSPGRRCVPSPRPNSIGMGLRSSCTSRCSAHSSGAQCRAATLDRPGNVCQCTCRPSCLLLMI